MIITVEPAVNFPTLILFPSEEEMKWLHFSNWPNTIIQNSLKWVMFSS